MNNLCIDVGYRCLNKHGEQLCGDSVQIVKNHDDSMILVLADGLGSGVKASILSTLTSKIISTMMANSMTLEDCVSTIAATLPVCKKRGIAYSTFSIISVNNNGEAEIIQYDNPKVIFLRDGKNFEYDMQTHIIGDKKIYESKITIKQDDVLIAMSDGAVYAGVGRKLNFGWKRENIINFIEENYDRKLTARTITTLLLEKCAELYAYQPGDDTTIATVKIKNHKMCNLMIGPPADPDNVDRMMALFFAKEGYHVVCGGTTSNLAARYLNKEIKTSLDYVDPEIPPIATIEGVDLVTEGVITISKVLQYAKSYLDDNSFNSEWIIKEDGASQIARILFEEATDISFFVGTAINPAHQNPDLPVHINIKINLVEELAKTLRDMGKTVELNFF
ncbi:MAG TPA: SpoIIE family protein phosphatase [Thermoclostridium sp.]